MANEKAWWSKIRDYAVLTGLVVAANYFLARNDMGWRSLNPSPWLLPGVLIGARYGFSSGLLCGLVTDALYLALAGAVTGNPRELIEQNAYYLFALAVGGAAAGELRDVVWRRSSFLVRVNEDLTDENTHLRAQIKISREAKYQIQRQLAMYNAPVAALDEELAALFDLPPEDFANALLHLLHRLTKITSAGIYQLQGTQLHQVAVIHPTPALAETLALQSTPLAEKALEMQQLASVAFTDLTIAQPFLAALPWKMGAGRSTVLLIQDLPLEDFQMSNLARIEWILSWAGVLLRAQEDFGSAFRHETDMATEAFRKLLDKAFNTVHAHGLPSMVLKFTTFDPNSRAAGLSYLPKTALTTALPNGEGWAVLLPFAGEIEANRVQQAMLAAAPQWRCVRYLVSEPGTPELLWSQLSQPAAPSAP